MRFINLLPFTAAPEPRKSRSAQVLKPEDRTLLAKLFKVASLAMGQTSGGGDSRSSFESSPYDFDRIIQAIDTDSYIRQAFLKYKELMWKEGWEILGDNPEAVDYLYQRFDYMEISMGRPFHDFLVEVGDQLVKFNNTFIARSYGDLKSVFPAPLQPATETGENIIGYYIIPTETVEIARDKNNNPKRYQQNASGGGVGGSGKNPTWKPEEIVHFYADKKPGRAFGAPFILPVLDDVISLRQLEEDILNLTHRELFPMYVYTVGTEERPAEDDEITRAANELENMRVEGGIIVPERHKLEVLGAEAKALDASKYLEHFVNRVVTGLGLAPHHLGLMSEGGNRSVTDRLDIALYDKVKTYQRYLARMFELNILNELLIEGGFDPMGSTANGMSDRCQFRFREIDVDTQVKRDAAALQMYTSNAVTLPEVRSMIGQTPDTNESEMLMAMQARMTPNSVKANSGNGETPTTDTTPTTAQGDQAQPSTGGRPNTPNAANRQLGNKVRPQNQFGRRNSPAIRHWAEWADEIANILDNE